MGVSYDITPNLDLQIDYNMINYDDFEHNDEAGNNVGSFSAHDQVITFGFGKPLNEKITLGINVNLLNSQLETYTSFAIASNVSASYYHAEKQFTSTLLFKNIGRQLIAYANEKESLPFDVPVLWCSARCGGSDRL